MIEINKIYNMDCAEGISLIDDESVALTITSPPYDNLRSYNGYLFDFEKVSNELFRVTKNGGIVIWVVGDSTINGSESLTSFKQALHFVDIGFNLHDTMIYQKINYIPLTHNRYEQSFEYMFCFSKGTPKTFNPIMIPCKNAGKIESYGSFRRSSLDRNQAMRAPEGLEYKVTKDFKIHPNIFSYTLGGEKTGHPAVFPNKLAYDQIVSWSNKNDLILDPFMGSGTVACMCKILNHNYIGFEISEEYCNLSNRRIKNTKVNKLKIGI